MDKLQCKNYAYNTFFKLKNQIYKSQGVPSPFSLSLYHYNCTTNVERNILDFSA